jgi:hypothetical protein
MSRAVRILISSGVFFAAAVPAAHAATPFTAGVGAQPSVAVGADGTGHAVWATTEDNSRVGYCRVSAGATSCNRSDALSFGGPSNANSTGRPVVFTPSASKIVIVAGCWNCGLGGITDRTFRWTSINNGESFGAPVEIGRSFETHGTGLWLDDAGIFVGASSSRAKAADLTAGEGVQYASGGIFVYSPEVARVPGSNKLVAATNDLDVVKYGVFDGSPFTVAGVNSALNWEVDRTLGGAEGDNSETALNSGPNGVFLSYEYFVANDSRVGLRRFDSASNTFGAPTYVEGPDAIDDNSLGYPDSFQDASGRLHVIWRTLHSGGRLRYRVSDTSGANFTPAANLAVQEGFHEPEVAAGADGKGFAVWTPGTTGNIRIVPLDPQPEPVVGPSGGGGGTASPGGGGTTRPTIAPVFRFTGPGTTLTATIVGSRIRIRIRGTIKPPAGVSTAAACNGKLKLTIKKKRKTLAKRKARLKLKSGRCRFGKTVFVKRSRVGKARKLRLKVRFPGNSVLKAGQTTKVLLVTK